MLSMAVGAPAYTKLYACMADMHFGVLIHACIVLCAVTMHSTPGMVAY